jgi:hypothetical protein
VEYLCARANLIIRLRHSAEHRQQPGEQCARRRFDACHDDHPLDADLCGEVEDFIVTRAGALTQIKLAAASGRVSRTAQPCGRIDGDLDLCSRAMSASPCAPEPHQQRISPPLVTRSRRFRTH